jgi:DNA helicase-2/ATP-dependent DNA helicase PcrA
MDNNHLNERQREAVISTDGPLLILAGAGSGKTRVLTYRIARLIQDKKVHPQSILSLTFTNKAAKEMRHRVEQLTHLHVEAMWIGTFHAMCLRILKQHATLIGYTRDFTIYDTQDQRSVIKDILKTQQINEETLSHKFAHGRISDCKNASVLPEHYIQTHGNKLNDKRMQGVYEAYEKRLKQANAMDFDDLILKALGLLKSQPEVLAYYQDRFQYILVDEYQDTNRTQYELVRLLALKHQNLCVVGDNDQSIYSWRGADMRNILDFEKDFVHAKVILLEQNYRSTQTILDVANAVIVNNFDRKDKRLWTDNQSGEKVKLYTARDEKDEAFYVISQIEKEVGLGGSRFEHHAVLYRTNAQSRAYEDVLRRFNIPYKIVGGLKFYDRKEIKDVMAYLRLVANTSDDISLFRVLQSPKRGIGDGTLDKIRGVQEEDQSLYDAMKMALEQNEIGERALKPLRAFIREFEGYIESTEHLDLVELYERMITNSGYLKALELENTVEAKSRIENIQEMASVLSDYQTRSPEGSLSEFLSEITLMSDQDMVAEDKGFIWLMTLHAAKGLEFPYVYLVGLEDGLFPSQSSVDDPDGLEEERRLFYVGITRAERQLTISHAQMRMQYGMTKANPPSRFLREIPKNLMDKIGASALAKPEFTDLSSLGYKIRTTESAPFSVPKEDLGLKPGHKIRHKIFGLGTVISIRAAKNDQEITIAFDQKGIKVLALSIAPLERVD